MTWKNWFLKKICDR